MSDKPDEDLYKELYARFGFAYYQSECVHRELCMILAAIQVPSKDQMTRPRVEELFARSFAMNLGDVVKALEPDLPKDLVPILDEVVRTRNFVAHHFWYDRAPNLLRIDSVNELIEELNGYTSLFETVDQLTTSLFDAIAEGIGVTDQILRESYEKVVSGSLLEPLPTKDQMKALDRKLKGTVKIIHAWVVPTSTGKEALVFEEDDGRLWQLCDVGLGWTLFKSVGPDWRAQTQIEPFLPAAFKPRPSVAGPWEYHLDLGGKAHMVVRPGKEPGTFRWEVRAT